MTHALFTRFQSIAFFGAVRLQRPPVRTAIKAPEPQISYADPEIAGDAWLFDHPHTALSSAAYMLGQDVSRVSASLASLRTILTNLARIQVSQTAEPSDVVRAESAATFDALLFDDAIDRPVKLVRPLPFEDADLFFEGAGQSPPLRHEAGPLARVA